MLFHPVGHSSNDPILSSNLSECPASIPPHLVLVESARHIYVRFPVKIQERCPTFEQAPTQ